MTHRVFCNHIVEQWPCRRSQGQMSRSCTKRQIMWFWHYVKSLMCVWMPTNQPINQSINQWSVHSCFSLMCLIWGPRSHVFLFRLFQETLSNVFNLPTNHQPTNQSINQLVHACFSLMCLIWGPRCSLFLFRLFQLTLSNVFKQPTNQSINQSINQSNYQSINQSISPFMFPSHVFNMGSKI